MADDATRIRALESLLKRKEEKQKKELDRLHRRVRDKEREIENLQRAIARLEGSESTAELAEKIKADFREQQLAPERDEAEAARRWPTYDC